MRRDKITCRPILFHLACLAEANFAKAGATYHLSATTAFFGSVTTGESRCGMPS
jgi:hypothetical protein